MIIKSMSRKSKSFGQVVRYINEAESKTKKPIVHNLKTLSNDPDLKEVEKEFLKNSKYIRKRKNGIYLFPVVSRLTF